MKVLVHHIYEYKKGVRHLVLHTLNAACRDRAESKLQQQDISYVIQEVTSSKINVFFGDLDCVNIVRELGVENKKLNELTSEEDFMLGTMLGYNCLQQCQRYLQQKKQEHNFLVKILSQKKAG